MRPIKKQNKHCQISLLIQIRAEIAQSQISDDNNNMLFHFLAAPVQVQSNNYEKQKSNDDTTDQLQQHQSV